MDKSTGLKSPDVGTEQIDIAQLLHDVQNTTARLGEALREKDASYQQLCAKYEALRGVVDGIFDESDPRKNLVESYILVLVDAQSHQFRENYVHAAESGGDKAAALLKNAVMEHFGSEQCNGSFCRTIIRVYANLKKLSVDSTEEYAAKKPGFTKPSFPRSLGGFAAGFSRHDACVDFVDVADDAAVERKICELFRMSIKDPSCYHIFFGASGSGQYARVLREHAMLAKKVTLIQRGHDDTSLASLDLPSVIFSEAFEPLELKQAASDDTKEPPKTPKSRQLKKHANPTPSNSGSNQKKVSQVRAQLMHSPPAHLAPLPLKGPPGTIPINAAGHRIDLHMNAPTTKQWDEYKACIATRMICDRFHLGRGCQNKQCTYDHDPITPTQRYCHRFVRRAWTCFAGGKCRNIDCFRGHICQCESHDNGTVSRCKMPAVYHGIDRRVERWITSDEEHEGQDENDRGVLMNFGNLIDV